MNELPFMGLFLALVVFLVALGTIGRWNIALGLLASVDKSPKVYTQLAREGVVLTQDSDNI